jgi:hypothetical protein
MNGRINSGLAANQPCGSGCTRRQRWFWLGLLITVVRRALKGVWPAVMLSPGCGRLRMVAKDPVLMIFIYPWRDTALNLPTILLA